MSAPVKGAVGGLDVGTTGCKFRLYAPDGRPLGQAYRAYPAHRSGSRHEISAEQLADAVMETLAEGFRICPDIAGIGVTSFGETFAALDESDRVLFPCMLYTDPRGAAECIRLEERLGAARITAITGLRPHSMYSLPKIMALRAAHPEAFRRVRRLLLIENYIVYLLTGTAQCDYSMAGRTMAFDYRRLCWNRELLDAAEIPAELLPRPVPTGTAAGTLRRSLMERLGARTCPVVVSLGHDQMANAIGTGISDDCAADGSGTVECITPVFRSLPPEGTLQRFGLCPVPYRIPGTYICYAFSFTGGGALQWFTDAFARAEQQCAAQAHCSVFQWLERELPAPPTGILVLPHFAGAAVPYMDSGSRAAIVGLTLAHGVTDVYQAILEGVAFEMQINIDALATCGIRVPALRASGGGAKSAAWMQIKADVTGVPVTALASADAGTVGCAMMAGAAAGVFGDVSEAAQQLIRPARTFFPDSARHEAYRALYDRYRSLYAAVRPLVGTAEKE